MASGVQSITQGIVDSTSTPATARVPANFRVTASGQPIGVVGDVITFNGLPTASGSWVVGSMRVTIQGLPAINESAQGISVLSNGSPGGPIRVQTSDPRVKAG
jgi:hypothetical protein